VQLVGGEGGAVATVLLAVAVALAAAAAASAAVAFLDKLNLLLKF
jgi:hypothetical protein